MWRGPGCRALWDRRRLHTGQRLWGSLGLIQDNSEPTKGAEQGVGRPLHNGGREWPDRPRLMAGDQLGGKEATGISPEERLTLSVITNQT